MKNITLSAEPSLIQQARKIAVQHRTTLNALFREWLKNLGARKTAAHDYMEIMRKLKHVKTSVKFTREEMNER